MDRSLSRSRVVAAPLQVVFDLLADPGAHPRIDGSGTVRGVVAGPARLFPGARFGMRTRRGLPYVIRNTVVEYDEGRRIAWRHWGRHRWRYELAPLDGGTLVTETFDWSPSLAPRVLELLRFPQFNAKGIEASLDRLAGLAEERARGAR